MQKREGRSFAPLPTPPSRLDIGRTGRKSAPHTGLPVPTPLPSLTSALSRRAALFGAVTVAGASAAAVIPAAVQAAAVPSRAPTASVAPPISVEAKALQAELARLSSTYRRACQEADATNDATVEVDPPEALFWQPGDNDKLWGRCPVESWASPGRHWYADADLIERLRADPFHTLAGTPMKGAARRDEIVEAWDGWRANVKAAEDSSGYTAAEARYEAARDAYADFRAHLVELRTDDPEVMTVKALAIADLCRGTKRFEACIAAEIKEWCGAYEGALSLSLARDFIGLLGTGVSA